MLSACSCVCAGKSTALCSICPPPERVHASEHLLRTGPTFRQTVMVSDGVSKLSCTELFLPRDAYA